MDQGLARAITVALVVLLFTAAPALAGPPPAPPTIHRPVVSRAAVDQVEPDRLVIRGMNFGVTTAPVVLLSEVRLEVLSFSDEQIVVRLPLDAPRARYRLQVVAQGTAPSPLYEVTLGQPPGRGPRG